ncbi:MAG: ACP S-malonyltransferase, partial [Rhodocyclaceae bacterium]|nr:ACP S-malonyltransferase [Rhodocyclaceae bacterium]
QAASPVRWVETMQAMAAQGVSHVYECGPGKVLAGLVRRCAEGLIGGAMADLAGIDVALAATHAQEKSC